LPPTSTTTEKTRASITIQPDVTRNWTVGHNGQLKYAALCEFSGGRILAERDGHIEQCGASCLADPRCTHFNTYSDYCYLKSITEGPAISEDMPDQEMHCGYIVNSSKPVIINNFINLRDNALLGIKWKSFILSSRLAKGRSDKLRIERSFGKKILIVWIWSAGSIWFILVLTRNFNFLPTVLKIG